jgi:hypothetical protein
MARNVSDLPLHLFNVSAELQPLGVHPRFVAKGPQHLLLTVDRCLKLLLGRCYP